MSSQEITDMIEEALYDKFDQDYEDDVSDVNEYNITIESFENAGVLTTDNGLVIKLPDGSEYQVTVVQSK